MNGNHDAHRAVMHDDENQCERYQAPGEVCFVAKSASDNHVLRPLELQVMEAVWSQGASTVASVHQRINSRRQVPLAYTTVMTVMSRLFDKGVLARTKEGRGYTYKAITERGGIAHLVATRRIRSLLTDFGPVAVTAFVDQVADDPEAMRLLARLTEPDSDNGHAVQD